MMHATPRQSPAAFTLLELLVAAAAFSMLLLLLIQAISGIDGVTRSQRNYIEAVSAARQSFDRIGQDIRTLLTEGDASVMMEMRGAQQSDRLSFLSLVRPSASMAAGSDPVRMTRVVYEVGEETPDGESDPLPQLLRRQIPVYWNPGDYDLAQVLTRSPNGQGVVSPVATGVFRLEIVWIRRDGTLSRNPQGASAVPADGEDESPLPAGFVRVDPEEVKGFIVSLAVLDSAELRRMDNFASLYESFSPVSPSATGSVPAHEWRGKIASVQPENARRNVRILQRTYYLWQ